MLTRYPDTRVMLQGKQREMLEDRSGEFSIVDWRGGYLQASCGTLSETTSLTVLWKGGEKREKKGKVGIGVVNFMLRGKGKRPTCFTGGDFCISP